MGICKTASVKWENGGFEAIYEGVFSNWRSLQLRALPARARRRKDCVLSAGKAMHFPPERLCTFRRKAAHPPCQFEAPWVIPLQSAAPGQERRAIFRCQQW
jgi:hypothetical protein